MATLNPEMSTIILEGEENPNLLRFLQVRQDIKEHLDTLKYPIRVDLSWHYTPDASGMPSEEDSEAMSNFEEAVQHAMEKNKLALLTYRLTGEGLREWCFYTRNIKAFETTLNSSTATLPTYPIEIYAEEDREYSAYTEIEPLLAHAEE